MKVVILEPKQAGEWPKVVDLVLPPGVQEAILAAVHKSRNGTQEDIDPDMQEVK